MLNFPTKTLNSIKQALLRQQKEVEENIKDIEKEDPVKEDGVAESSEPGTDSYIAETHTKTLALGQQLKNVRDSIKKALVKIGKGSYGKCEDCGKYIEIKRLMAMPTASLCLTCSAKAAKKR